MKLRAVTLSLFAALAFAGPGWAGDAVDATQAVSAPAAKAVVAHYQIRDAKGERSLVLVRSADRIEYRMQGQPVEIWRQTPDGISRLELFAKEQRSVAWSPGDLRTTGQMPDWDRLASVVNPSLRKVLKSNGQTKVLDTQAVRYSGESAEGQPISLDWIDAEGLPAYYRTGKRNAKAGDAGAYELRLSKIERVDSAAAFTATGDYRETDYADLGDMELDPFAANYLKQRGEHSH
ncbi:hypothetical protein [Pseudomonas sp. CGJS7]|uniref:hypothetical protein n=1 Tax=Pseudomonas sp. CGJS7 TaxID=3109348 RepID=UPI00300B4627